MHAVREAERMTIPDAPQAIPYAIPTPAPSGTTPSASSGLAIAALIIGIVAFVSGFAPVWGLLAGGAAVGLGVLAFVKKQNKALALIGAILGGLAFLTSLITTLVLVAGLAGAVSNPSSAKGPVEAAEAGDSPTSEITAEATESPTPDPVETAKAAPAPPAAPAETVSQSNAKRAANSYLDYTAFSRSGLIDQLEFEGYSTEDATYGTDAAGADWNEQAVASAKNYLDYTSFSHSGLVDQLVFEGFSPAEAEFGVTANGL